MGVSRTLQKMNTVVRAQCHIGWGGLKGGSMDVATGALKLDWSPEVPLSCYSSVLLSQRAMTMGAIPCPNTSGANESNRKVQVYRSFLLFLQRILQKKSFNGQTMNALTHMLFV